MSHYEQITAADGGAFDAYCALPAAPTGPGILLFQEIFGINDNMRGLADKLAAEGYVALVPDMFWRLQRRFESKDESGMAEAFALVQQLDFPLAAADMRAALAHLRAMPACSGKIGAVGFCLGGTLAYLFAATSDPDAVVPYYGSGIATMLEMADQITCPVLFHYGNRDEYIPTEQIEAVEAAFAGRPDVTVLRYDAGHAFSNWDAPTFHDPEAADLAWPRTLAFFAEHLR